MKSLFDRYFSVSTTDRQWGFFVTSAGHSVVPAGVHYPIGQHPERYRFEWGQGRILEEFALLLIADGEGKFEDKRNSSFTLQRGDLLLLPPGLLHRYRPNSAVGWEEYWVTFDGTIPRRWYAQDVFAHRMPLAARNAHIALTDKFSELITAARQPIYSPQLLASLAQVILSEAFTSKKGDTTAIAEEDRLRRAADAISKHPSQFNLQTLASMADMAESTFRRKFKDYFGTTPSSFAQEALITQAKRWLMETPLTIRAISEKLDFSSEFYFMRSFKRSTGHTPGQWRKEIRLKAH